MTSINEAGAPQGFRVLHAAFGPWGDYGHMLAHGMSAHRPRLNGQVQLERTEPFIPPATMPVPNVLIVTQSLRSEIEAAGFSGFSFAPVIKAHITRVLWEDWDRGRELPPKMPRSNEPANYVLGGRHDPGASASLGDLWEVLLQKVGVGRCEQLPGRRNYRYFVGNMTGAPDIFHVDGLGTPILREGLAEWLQKRTAPWIEFREASIAELSSFEATSKEDDDEDESEISKRARQRVRELLATGVPLEAALRIMSKEGSSRITLIYVLRVEGLAVDLKEAVDRVIASYEED